MLDVKLDDGPHGKLASVMVKSCSLDPARKNYNKANRKKAEQDAEDDICELVLKMVNKLVVEADKTRKQELRFKALVAHHLINSMSAQDKGSNESEVQRGGMSRDSVVNESYEASDRIGPNDEVR